MEYLQRLAIWGRNLQVDVYCTHVYVGFCMFNKL